MGGLGYFIACMIAMVISEAINFPIQRSFVFRSKRPVSPQIAWYVVAFCIVTVIVRLDQLHLGGCGWSVGRTLAVQHRHDGVQWRRFDGRVFLREQDYLPGG